MTSLQRPLNYCWTRKPPDMLDHYLPTNLANESDSSLRWELEHLSDYSLGVQAELLAEARRRGWNGSPQHETA